MSRPDVVQICPRLRRCCAVIHDQLLSSLSRKAPYVGETCAGQRCAKSHSPSQSFKCLPSCQHVTVKTSTSFTDNLREKNSQNRYFHKNSCGTFMMETCVLIPSDFSLVLKPHPDPRNIFEMCVSLWANRTLCPGQVFRSDQGVIRLDTLEIYKSLREDNVSDLFFIELW